MELFSSSFPDNRTDHIQRELKITDRPTTRDSKDQMDELQLAALLGKTLLEKNEDLEMKLRKLQDFAEETLVANQTLTRQLAETTDSLHYSNRLYEQLEVKLEESEESNKQLQKQHRTSQALVEKKNTSLGDVEKELAQLKEERVGLRAELDKLRKDADFVWGRERDQLRKSKSPGREKTPILFDDDDSVDEGIVETESEEVVRLRSTVRDLSIKLQSSVSQKRQLEREMEELVGDNTGLSHSLEKMEGDMSMLQLRLEEAQERSVHLLEAGVTAEVTSPTAIVLQSVSHLSTPVSTHTADINLPTVIVTPDHNRTVSTTPTTPPPSSTTSTITATTDCTEPTPVSDSVDKTTNGQSIFYELDSEYSSLQQQYQDLLTNCVCSAGLSQHVKTEGEEESKPSLQGCKKVKNSSVSSSSGGPFKELFDEMFATLRQTAQVADRLIEGRRK